MSQVLALGPPFCLGLVNWLLVFICHLHAFVQGSELISNLVMRTTLATSPEMLDQNSGYVGYLLKICYSHENHLLTQTREAFAFLMHNDFMFQKFS